MHAELKELGQPSRVLKKNIPSHGPSSKHGSKAYWQFRETLHSLIKVDCYDSIQGSGATLEFEPQQRELKKLLLSGFRP